MIGIDIFKDKYNLINPLIFSYGSRVYGTQSEKSDWDFIAIASNGNTGEEYRHDNVNVHIYNTKDWENQLNDHKIHTLEVQFLPDKKPFSFKLNLQTLRHSLGEKASHSFVKAKKKIEVEKDYYVGWKSLFHSLRILNFGIQIATKGKIVDYGSANHYWFEILNSQMYDWNWFKEKYQPIYNNLSTEFRKVAPK